MYTYPNLSSILSSLSSLTVAELKVLHNHIDLILNNKNIINNQGNIAINYIPDTFSQPFARISILSGYCPVTVASLENVNLGLIGEQSITDSLLQLEQLKNDLNQKSSSTQKPDRPLGVWKGKVRMSDDFNDSSSDILSEFGIEE